MTFIASGLIAICFVPIALAQSSDGSAGRADTVGRLLRFVEPSQQRLHLTSGERFHLYVLNTVGPLPLLGEAAGAGISQWMDSPKEWGQGWGAYSKRLGANLAYNGVRQSITYGMSEAFGEDNRYFPSQRSGFWSRTRHALVSTFSARHADGTDTFSISSVAGVVGASALSSTWGPESWKSPRNIAKNAGISFGATAAFNVVREFLPDILHRPRK